MADQKQTQYKDPKEMSDEELLEEEERLKRLIEKEERDLEREREKMMEKDPVAKAKWEEMEKELAEIEENTTGEKSKKEEKEYEPTRNFPQERQTIKKTFNPAELLKDERQEHEKASESLAKIKNQQKQEEAEKTEEEGKLKYTKEEKKTSQSQTEPEKHEEEKAPYVSDESEQTRKEIERMKERLKALDEKEKQAGRQEAVKQYTPPSQNETLQKMAKESKEEKVEPANMESKETEGKRYGVTPAKDLSSSDFDWQGNVAGVEIERNTDIEEEENNNNNLDRAKVLEEIEHPPAYTPSTDLDEKLSKTGDDSKPPEESEEVSQKNEVEKVRERTYKEGDPYREPLE